eukprot:CAMPEP_0204301642 /NCGR_PEP_ID=MMETSP0468-20130131/80758_1 /ASSEMBLY_ACC=CAM_ASM_000383 /TAXON_ID=2969 /ORGANISM="Oxyrrhis marina" /LENGTH=95 /DNA_ID=CAMNT_0051280799 /DNA_START=307 /DNA_END=591 /DNA_ORIENTATION=+
MTSTLTSFVGTGGSKIGAALGGDTSMSSVHLTSLGRPNQQPGDRRGAGLSNLVLLAFIQGLHQVGHHLISPSSLHAHVVDHHVPQGAAALLVEPA